MTVDVDIGDTLSFGNVASVLAQSDRIIAAGALDLAAVERIDSAGVALLLELTRRARRAGGCFRIHGLGDRSRSLLAFFGVDIMLELDGSSHP